MNVKFFASFLAHSILATVGAMLGGILLSVLVSLPFAFFSSGMGNIFDRIGDTWFLRYGVDGPFPIVPVLVAACIGFASPRLSKTSAPAWVWIIPTVLLLVSVAPRVFESPSQAKWVLDNYFGRGCGSSECLYELFITAPFYTSLAYTMGWLVRRQTSRAGTSARGPA